MAEGVREADDHWQLADPGESQLLLGETLSTSLAWGLPHPRRAPHKSRTNQES